jgi:hypothetical protein
MEAAHRAKLPGSWTERQGPVHRRLSIGIRGPIERGLLTREVRSPESQAYAILNDSEQTVPAEVPEALGAYNIRPVSWSRREELGERLAA